MSAEDFDGTGILAGIDPCASNYWWMPELYGPDMPFDSGSMPPIGEGTARPATGRMFDSLRADRDHATRRDSVRTTAAA